jgi:hypothetical protein
MRAPKGKQQGQQQQSLFLLYLDAVSISNSKRAVRQGALPAPAPAAAAGGALAAPHQQQAQQPQQQQQAAPSMGALPPNMPDFTVKDLQFILTFIGQFSA